MTILVTGCNGQLGSELRRLAPDFPRYNFIFTSKAELSVTDEKAVSAFFEKNTIDVCINGAAYTAVDKAESDVAAARMINGTAVGYLAAVCARHKARLVHVSTDYVFDGNGDHPYKESDPVDPVNEYGYSKLLGENLAMENNDQCIIIRTSWLYSSFGNNFVKTMKRLMTEKQSINVVNDQMGCPTYAADLAETILSIISGDKLVPGIYHYSNEGIVSWYGFALEIKRLMNSGCQVNPIDTASYPTAAKRPGYSVMDTSLIKETFGIIIPNWKDSLARCMNLI